VELNTEAWERWKAYRIAIKKPLKPASEEAAKLKLMRYEQEQDAVVDQSIGNGWQGLFPPNKGKADPHAPKVRSKAQEEAEAAHCAYIDRMSEKYWNSLPPTPINRLKLAAALLARYDVRKDQEGLQDKREWLKEQVASWVRKADPQEVLDDLDCWRLVLRLFSGAGLIRLRLRAEQRA
jgi:hypothetical protein